MVFLSTFHSMRCCADIPQRAQAEKKAPCRISTSGRHALRSIKSAFITLGRKIDKGRKVVIYQTTVTFELALHALMPKKRHWWDKIEDRVILGAVPLKNKGHLEALQKLGVTLVLSKLEDLEYGNGLLTHPVRAEDWRRAGIELWRSPTPDGARINPGRLEADVARIRQEVARGGLVYVHCKAGMARSAMTVAAWEMAEKNISADQAVAYLKSKRRQVHLNILQIKELRQLKK